MGCGIQQNQKEDITTDDTYGNGQSMEIISKKQIQDMKMNRMSKIRKASNLNNSDANCDIPQFEGVQRRKAKLIEVYQDNDDVFF